MVRVPTEFDLLLQSERERWLRRRLLCLCGVGAILALLANTPKFWHHLHDRGHEAEGWVNFIEGTLLLFLYVSTGAYALWHRLKQPSLLRLVFWLVIIVGAVELICSRAIANLYVLTDTSSDMQLKAATISMLAALTVLTFDHLLACLFMPWTVRESLPAAAVLLGMYSASLLWDVALAALPIFVVASIPLLAICFIPGTLICLWRTSRFRTIFKLRFESSRYRELQGELASARRLHEASMPRARTDGPIRLHIMYTNRCVRLAVICCSCIRWKKRRISPAWWCWT